MSDLIVSDEVAEELHRIAIDEQREIEDVLRTMIQQYISKPAPHADSGVDPLVGLIGLLDDEIEATDLSTTIRETLKEHTNPKYGWTKRDRTD